jgi:hypothetical protein
VGRDDELRAGPRRSHDDRQQGESAADRQRRLGLVKQVKALAAEPAFGEREKRFPVRLLVQRQIAVQRAVRRKTIPTVDEFRDLDEALGAEEVPLARFGAGQDRLEGFVEDRSRYRRELSESREFAALGREAHCPGNRLDQGRLPGTVLARQHGDRAIEI